MKAKELFSIYKLIKAAPKLQPKIIFVSITKIGENTTNILNCYFSKQIYTLRHQDNTYAQRIKFTLQEQYLLDLLFSKNAKETNIDQSILHKSFYSVRQKSTRKPLKEAAAKNFFSSVYVIGTACFDLEDIISYTGLSLH